MTDDRPERDALARVDDDVLEYLEAAADERQNVLWYLAQVSQSTDRATREAAKLGDPSLTNPDRARARLRESLNQARKALSKAEEELGSAADVAAEVSTDRDAAEMPADDD